MLNKTFKLFVTCPAGIEALLGEELCDLGITDAKQTVTGVLCEATIEQAYRICLWSRLANRVLLVLANAKSGDSDHLYNVVSDIDWGEHLGESENIRVDFAGQNEAIRHTLYGARVVKDAIVDQFTSQGLDRPGVNLDNPDHFINVRLTPKSLYVSLDLSGQSLHKRNYRLAKGSAPIKENLAAALLARAKWPTLLGSGSDLIDPMCGSGTFLIEAAMMAADIAPGLLRKEYAFQRWFGHDAKLWSSLLDEAETRKAEGLRSVQNHFYGFEIEKNIARQAIQNIKNAGLSSLCSIELGRLSNSELSAAPTKPAGLIVGNPPYGMRLGEVETLSEDYRSLADECKRRFPDWTMGILSSSRELLAETRLRYDKKYRLFNGAIECEFRTYVLSKPEPKKAELDGDVSSDKQPKRKLTEGGQMVANRLSKNVRKLKAWRSKNNISCYRIYDADLPEYAAAIDVYADKLHIQEYQAPRSIDPKKAELRFNELVDAAKHSFNIQAKDIVLKTRKKNRGSAQYQKHSELNSDDFLSVKEGKVNLYVNLHSYLDTGLFLDHRPLRLRIAAEAKGRSFLNLFSYTSSASVHAIVSGASESTSVDMSNTYVAWSALNFEHNNIRSNAHEIVRADVNEWLSRCRRGYDLIMLDPPSFSNSKKMEDTFDVQRDHQRLIERCMELLKPAGTLYFSNNLRSFKLNDAIPRVFAVTDISEETIDADFQRNKKIHTCFKIQHR